MAGSDFVMDILGEADSRIADANGNWQAACDGDMIDWTKTNEFIVALIAKCNSHGGCTATLRLQWRRDSEGTWYDLGTTGELRQGTGTALVNCTSPSNYESGCQTLEDSHEIEGDNQAELSTTGKTYVEIDVAVDPSNALDGETYSFRIYDVTAGAPIETDPWDAQITMATGAVIDKDFSDVGGGSDAFVNPYRTMGFDDVGGGVDTFVNPFRAMGFSEVGQGSDVFVTPYREMAFSDVASGVDVFFLLTEKGFSDVGAGVDVFSIPLKGMEFQDSGLGSDVFSISFKAVIFSDVGAGADAFSKEIPGVLEQTKVFLKLGNILIQLTGD
ncbi:MAG: hypothetical protein ACE5I5_19925 [Candidatus Heimdallarchaeota archaeon]